MDDGVFLFDKESAEACDFTFRLWRSLRTLIGVSFREPAPGERAGFDVKAPNTIIIVTPNVFGHEQVQEGFVNAVGTKRNIVFLHHIRSGCNLEEEIRKSGEAQKKAIDKALKDEKYMIYTEDLSEECNDMLVKKLTLKDAPTLQQAYEKRCSTRNIDIMKYSAKVSKARTCASTKRKYDLCITSAEQGHSPDGIPVVESIFDTFCKLAPALSIGRAVGDSFSNSDVRHSFNLVVVISKDTLTCPQALEKIKVSLESDGNILVVHNLASCPDIEQEFAKCEDPVLLSCVKRAARFTYLQQSVVSTVLGILHQDT